MTEIIITPDTRLFPTLGNTGYRFVEALAEFVDNSIDAASSKCVTVKINLDSTNLEIADDASGIPEDKFRDSLRLAAIKGIDKNLGEFGLGMKTAAVALGRVFRIQTTTKGEKHWRAFNYDEEKWKNQTEWKADIIKMLKENPDEHGTIIRIKDFKFKFYPNLVTNSKNELGKRYATYIRKGTLKAFLNNSKISPKDLALRVINGKKKHSIRISCSGNRIITGWYGFKEKRSLKGTYGFNLIKHGRIIVENAKIGFNAHPQIAMLAGELHLNFVPVSHNKREFILDTHEYIEAREKIKDFIDSHKILYTARKISTDDKKKKDEIKLKKRLEEITKNFELLDQNEIDVSKTYASAKQESATDSIEQTTIADGEEQKFKIRGKEYNVKFGLSHLGKQAGIGKCIPSSKSKLKILINMDFPFYSVVKDSLGYTTFLIVEFLAIFITQQKENKFDPIELRNRILEHIGTASIAIKEQKKCEAKIKKLKSELKKAEDKAKKKKH